MANRRSSPPPQAPQLTAMRNQISRIQRCIRELQDFDPTTIRDRSDPRIKSFEISINQVLIQTFGNGPERDLYAAAAYLDRAPLTYGRPGDKIPLQEVVQGLTRGKEQAIELLNRAIQALEDKIADLGEVASQEPAAVSAEFSKDVFVVHGHDDPAKIEVARLIERAGLNAVILHEQPNAGQTIIEKFEAHGGSAGFAVVLLTPDDIGGPDREHLRPRARQNVIGEMFWFAGKFGRQHVCALTKGDVEMPSDFAGVGYIKMDDRGAWKTDLLRELKAAGYEVNWGEALA
jgi:predicted nucleotide-binding protein